MGIAAEIRTLMDIRPYTDADWPVVWAMLEPVFRAGETYAVDRDITQEEARQMWTGYTKEPFVAALEDGTVAGTYFMRPNADGPGSHICNCGYVVAEEARGRGVASALCEHSLQHARNRGYRGMQFNMVASTNTGAVRLWHQLGFETVGVLPRAFMHATHGPVDALVMFQSLDLPSDKLDTDGTKNRVTDLRRQLQLAEPTAFNGEIERGGPEDRDGYSIERIAYDGLEGDLIPAFFLTPAAETPKGCVVVFHQHNGEFHLGKSEVAGLAGDPLQAWGPELARRGFAVLAPDAVSFEDRRAGASGTTPDEGDWLQHYNALTYRLLDGDTLMRKCLDDAQRAVGVLRSLAGAKPKPVGVAGHSFGGLVALYLAALDPRCDFACVSGATASLSARRSNGTGVNMFEVVPGLSKRCETKDLIRAINPRPVLIVSGEQDPYSIDADALLNDTPGSVTHIRSGGGHALDQPRFGAIMDWLGGQVGGDDRDRDRDRDRDGA